MKCRIVITAIVLCTVFSVFAQHDKLIVKRDEKVLKMISSLPEVKEADAYIRKQTHNERHLTAYLDQTPTPARNKYTITVSEYNGMNLVPHFFFIVDAKTFAVSFWDVANDKAIPLKQWRKLHYRYYQGKVR